MYLYIRWAGGNSPIIAASTINVSVFVMWYAMTEMQMADGCLKFAGYFKNWVGRNS